MMKRRAKNFYTLQWLTLVWIVLAMFSVSSVCFAGQPTAKISAQSGNVMVSLLGQDDTSARRNMPLSQGDAIQTNSGASATLLFSDGSTVELGEHTMLYLAVLEQVPGKAARTSHLYLLWGKIRTVLTPGHQKKGSTFKIETFNAIVNTTFSEPDIEIIYDPHTDTTTAFAHTVPLSLTNLLTEKTAIIPQEHTGIVQGQTIEEKSQIVKSLEPIPPLAEARVSPDKKHRIRRLMETFHQTRRARDIFRHFHPQKVVSARKTAPSLRDTLSPPEPPQPVIDTVQLLQAQPESPKKAWKGVAIGAGALAAIGGIAVITSGRSDSDSVSPSFTGTFEKTVSLTYSAEDAIIGTHIITFNLTQQQTSITGDRVHTLTIPGCNPTSYAVSVTGTVQQNTGTLSYPAYQAGLLFCNNRVYSVFATNGNTCKAELVDSDKILRLSECSDSVNLPIDESGDYARK